MPERTKALKIVCNELVQLLHGVIDRDEVVEHRAGGGKDAGHIVEDLADFFDVGQHGGKAALVGGGVRAAEDGIRLSRGERAAGGGQGERVGQSHRKPSLSGVECHKCEKHRPGDKKRPGVCSEGEAFVRRRRVRRGL